MLDVVDTCVDGTVRTAFLCNEEQDRCSSPSRKLGVIVHELLVSETFLAEAALGLAHVHRDDPLSCANAEYVTPYFCGQVPVLIPKFAARPGVDQATNGALHYRDYKRTFNAKGDHAVPPLRESDDW